MSRYKVLFWLVFLAYNICLAFYIQHVRNSRDTERTGRQLCEEKLKGAIDGERSAGRIIRELREKASSDKSPMDCYYVRMPDYIVERLSKLK